MTKLQAEALGKLAVEESITLDCCNDPKHGVTNCPMVIRTPHGFALVGDDGQTIELSRDQMYDLCDRGGDMLDQIV